MKNIIKNAFTSPLQMMLLTLSLTVIVNCDRQKNNETPNDTTKTISANITANTTWTTGNTYILRGRIAVANGYTLTIQPGVIVKGEPGTGASASALLIARGAKIMAQGTATQPIIFTSTGDGISFSEIEAGTFASKNLSTTTNGTWGGLIVLGKAKISAKSDVTEVQIEGIPSTDANGLYGGNDDADNSGVLKYLSIRHGGTNIGEGNEINGLTLGGVGSGTTIENIEIVANQDDGVEFFGGTVNAKNILVWNVGDDAIDTDQAWAGTLDNFIVITPDGHNFELDGPEGTYSATHTIKNGTVLASLGSRTSKDLINVDANSLVNLENIFITSINSTNQKVNESTDDKTLADTKGVTFSNIVLNVTATDLLKYMDNASVPTGISAAATSTNKADKSVFSWTWASQAKQLTDL